MEYKDLSQDKIVAIKKILDWLTNSNKQYLTLGGYAGTGKTTLIAALRQELFKINPKGKIAFVSYTGKAAQVLSDKLGELNTLKKGDLCSTIHALIYSPLTNANEEIVGWEKKESINVNLIIIDEASMVDQNIWNDLLSYGKPVFAVGDHGQLPPIASRFNLMEKPDILLTQIHRQAEENPIIDISIQAREQGRITIERFSKEVIKFDRQDPESLEYLNELLGSFDLDTLILCGYNTTRIKFNTQVRSLLELSPFGPEKSDRVICLRNNHKKGIYNGMLGVIEKIEDQDEEYYYAEIIFDNQQTFSGLISRAQFNAPKTLSYSEQRNKTLRGDLFDYGYALTVHKAQGSQARRVIVFEERFAQMNDEEWRRWLYTAVTRAQEELYIFGS